MWPAWPDLSPAPGHSGKGWLFWITAHIQSRYQTSISATIDRMNPSAHTGEALFEAVIVPHRSLSPRGLRLLIGVLCALSCLTALRFWMIGAWPVAGFSLIEVGLAIFLIRLNAHRARESEVLLLFERTVRITRTDRHGRREEQALPADWLTIRLADRPGRVPALLLGTRGRQVEVATGLGELEKRDLADALRDAIDRQRNPRFDNPQLR